MRVLTLLILINQMTDNLVQSMFSMALSILKILMILLNIKRTNDLVSDFLLYHARDSSDDAVGPSCRTAVSKDKIFSRQAFEPTDADLDPTIVKPEGDDILDVSDIFEDAYPGTKGKGKVKKRFRRIVDSEDDSEGEMDSEMEDFIVYSDEDEAGKDARRAEKKRLGKKRAATKVESDYDTNSGEDRDVIYGKKTRVSMPKEQVEMLPRFLPSTKMKVNKCFRSFGPY